VITHYSLQNATVSKNIAHYDQPPGKTQPPTFSGMGNEYRPKCREALRLGRKGTYGSFHSWIQRGWQVYVNLCDRSLVNTCYIPESLRDEQLVIKRYTNKAYFTFTSSNEGQHYMRGVTNSGIGGYRPICLSAPPPLLAAADWPIAADKPIQ